MTKKLKHFTLPEFDCTYTGNNQMDWDFLAALDNLREVCGFPFVITSGYRDPSHPIESKKKTPGTHAQGIAVDIQVTSGTQRRLIVKEALKMGFGGIGVAKTFVHVDDREGPKVLWEYS